MTTNFRRACTALLLMLGGLLATGSHGVRAQTSPQTRPLVQAGNLVYLGKFTLPTNDGSGGGLSYGGAALGLGPDGQSLYFGCQDGAGMLARVSIPALGGVSTVVEPCRAVPNLQAIKPSDIAGIKLGGSLSWNGRLVVSAYVFYDGTGTALSSHFAGPGGVSTLTGPYRVGNDPPGMVGGYMGAIPQEWRSLLGGPALTGKCCTSVIWRSSYGPTASVFNPDHVGTQATIPSTMLVGYPDAHQTLGPWDAVNTYYTGTQRLGGLAFPAGTRSLLFVSRRGDTFCYGDGAQCNDPSDPDKGTHGYPYRHVVTAYDAVDLLAVKQGTKQPWEVLPYAQWTLTHMNNNGTADMSSAVYDQATRRWFITAGLAAGPPAVHVYEVNNAVAEPPTPVEVCGDGIDNDGDGQVDENCIAVCVAAGDQGAPSLAANDCLSPPAVPGVPVGLQGSTSGSTLSFTWSAPLTGGTVDGYDLEAGLAPGTTNSVTTLGPTTNTSLPGMASGTYYVRVRARNQYATSAPSNEVVVTVITPGCAVPASRADLTALVSGSTVALAWQPIDAQLVEADDGRSPVSYVIEVGSVSGATDIGSAPMGRVSSWSAIAPAGVYFVRVRPVNACGAGTPSADVRVTVR